MLDLSIKELKTEEDFLTLSNKDLEIREKIDGIKISLIRNTSNYDSNWSKNWIISYKGNRFFEEDFFFLNRDQIKHNTIGIEAIALVIDHIKTIHSRTATIPCKTEFLIEFATRKPTLTRQYDTLFKMFLISASSIKYSLSPGKIFTTPEKPLNAYIDNFSRLLQIPLPPLIHNGILNDPKKSLESFLNIQSALGGKPEGYVICGNKLLWKLLQPDQHSKEARYASRMKWEMEDKEEKRYFSQLKQYAFTLISLIQKDDVTRGLYDISDMIWNKNYSIHPYHKKKNEFQILEDFHYCCRYLYLKKISGNDGALFIGRFQPPTKTHIDIIKNAIRKYDSLTVCIIKSKEKKSPFSDEIIKEILLKECPKIKIKVFSTGNLLYIMSKIEKNINTVICGTDRKEDYENQLINNPEISVEVISRTDNISATQVRESILNGKWWEFKKLVTEKTLTFWYPLRNELGFKIRKRSVTNSRKLKELL